MISYLPFGRKGGKKVFAAGRHGAAEIWYNLAMKIKNYIFSAFATAVFVAGGVQIDVQITTSDGKTKNDSLDVEPMDGCAEVRIRKDTLPPNVKSVRLSSPDALVPAGSDGYWVSSSGSLGTFKKRAKDMKFRDASPKMPFFGAKTSSGAWVAIIKGMPYSWSFSVELKDGAYALSMAWDRHMKDVYEDLVVEFSALEDADADYAGMARAYRGWQLARKAVVPLKERAKTRPILDYMVKHPEVRVRLAWKPVPSPKPDQTPLDEPLVKPVITFDRFMKIVDEFKRQGIPGAEFCLVGWNIGGHDGRWPQAFPVEPSLGGEARLREAIRHAQNLGYNVSAHCNHRDAYLIAEDWDAEYIRERNADGTLRRGKTTWGGGRMYTICPRRAYERFATRQMPMLAALGFKGLHYLDVYSCVPVETCESPYHPLNVKESVMWVGNILNLARDTFGGVASEGGYDQNAGQLDYILYSSFERPFEEKTYKGLVDRLVPTFALVYNGIILYNPFTTTVNAMQKGRPSELKAIEFGARPTFYFYANFLTPGKGVVNWMGNEDLECGTDAVLAESVAAIKRSIAPYEKLSRLQYLWMEGHDELAADVYRTRYSDGTSVYVNYGKAPAAVDGVTVPAEGWTVK
jgi:hypothetical protein